jgi:NADH-quinone oxidoreductase subunit A
MGGTGAEGPYWPFWVYLGAVVILILGMIILSYLLGQRRMGRETALPFESGVSSTGSAHVRFSINFYLIALFFVVFDLESVFIFAWAVSAREVGVMGYAGVFFFIAMLLAALAYLWKIGALDYVRHARARLEEKP